MRRTFIFLAYACLGITSLIASSILPYSEIDIDTIVNDALEKFNVPGVAIGVAVNDRVVISKGYGTRKVNTNSPVSDQTLFPIASCTKAFTAFLLGQLVDEGKVAFDDPVIKYIPELILFNEDLTENLTIRDLLAHRTGMARHDPIWVFLDFPREQIPSLLQHLEPAYPLRTEFQYNNFMYALAGIVIERITGRTWEETCASQLLTPLGMNHANFFIDQLKANPDFSFPHAEINGSNLEIPFQSTLPTNPASGINANIQDMLKWVKLHLFNKELLQAAAIQPETLKEMHISHMPFSITESKEISILGYGLGWLIGKYRGLDFISHGGLMAGFSSEVSFLPSENIGLVILTNSSSNGDRAIFCIRNQILDKLLNQETTDWAACTQKIHQETTHKLQEALDNYHTLKSNRPTIHSLQQYAGLYEHPSYGAVEISIKNDNLFAAYGNMQIPLFYKSENIFSGQSFVLLSYGINPIFDFAFSENASQLSIGFESFRSAAPVLFRRY